MPFEIEVHHPQRQCYGTPQAGAGGGSGSSSVAPQPSTMRSLSRNWCVTTPPNSFGVYRRYRFDPTLLPSPACDPSFISHVRSASLAPSSSSPNKRMSFTEALGPFPNVTSLLVQHTYATESHAGEFTLGSQAKIDDLVFHPDYSSEDHWTWANSGWGPKLRQEMLKLDPPAYPGSGWDTNASFPLAVYVKGCTPKSFNIPFPKREITDVITSLLTHPNTSLVALQPYELWWTPPPIVGKDGLVTTSTDQRLYSEMYDSDHMLKTFDEVQELPLPCILPRIVISILWFSDATHPTNFSNTSLHPFYVACGNFPGSIRSRIPVESLQLTAWFKKVRLFFLLSHCHSPSPLNPDHSHVPY